VLDVHLDLSLQVVVVIVAPLQLEVDKKTVVIIEAKKLITRGLIFLKLLLKGDGIAATLDV
jgi:hypothetical protein